MNFRRALALTLRDAVIYALGVGACSRDAVDEKELKYVYHKDGQSSVQVLPTFPATFSLLAVGSLEKMPGRKFDFSHMLHGQQYMEIYKPFPSHGFIKNKAVIAGLHDKGKATVFEIETTSYSESGEALCMNRDCYIGYLETTILYMQILLLLVLLGSPFPFCMACAHLGLQLEQLSSVFAMGIPLS